VRTCFNLMRLDAVAAMPVIPGMATTILDSLQLTVDERAGRAEDHLDLGQLGGRPFTVVPPMVRKIEDAEVAALKERFGS
jgi:methionyl-tRNA synthetase